jgi:hypothetical protein
VASVLANEEIAERPLFGVFTAIVLALYYFGHIGACELNL